MKAEDESLRVRRNKTLRELALEAMRDAILGLHFGPGERLVERSLCEQLGVSRTVVREVLRHLEAEGLVETLPQKGPVVATPSTEDAKEIYEIRAMLEALGGRACAEHAGESDIRRLEKALKRIAAAFDVDDARAIRNATSEFYEILFLAGGKRIAWNVVQSLNARINYLRAMTISSPGRHAESLREMQRIFQAIRERNPDAADEACRAHVQRAAELAASTIRGKEAAVGE